MNAMGRFNTNCIGSFKIGKRPVLLAAIIQKLSQAFELS